MSLLKANKRVSVPELSFKRAPTRLRHNGIVAPRIAQAVFNPSANTAQRPIGAYGLGVYIPDNAIIIRVWIDVVTTFASAGADAGTIAVHAQAADDIVAAIAISDASNVWDAGIRGSKIGFPNFGADAAHDSALEVAALFAASMLKLTAERELTVTVAGQALTAGKAVVYAEFVTGD
jgi:hypothetical protein